MTAPMVHRSLGEKVYIAYLDDSRQDKANKPSFQVISAAIIKDEHFDMLEQHLAWSLYQSVPSRIADKIEEFHAADIWAQRPPFDELPDGQVGNIFSHAISAVEHFKIPVVYGAVDLRKLYSTKYASANPIDIAFRTCVLLVEEWFKAEDPNGLGLLISDDSSNQQVKKAMQNAFYLFRNRVRSSPMVRGKLEHLHDDMYFGESKYSIGIQIADICTFLIGRNLVGTSDTDELYQRLEKHIFKSQIDPE